MPHIAVTMIPGRDDATKKALAEKLQKLLMEELALDPKLVSVSIQDVPMDEWDASMRRFPAECMFVPPVC